MTKNSIRELVRAIRPRYRRAKRRAPSRPFSGRENAPSQRGEGARGPSGWLTGGPKAKPPWDWNGSFGNARLLKFNVTGESYAGH
jgi:hypothetical protein